MLAVLPRFAMLIIFLLKSEKPELKILIAYSYPKGNKHTHICRVEYCIR